MKAQDYVTDFEHGTTGDFYREMGITIFKWLGWKVLILIVLVVVL